jgi:hypothetical protein
MKIKASKVTTETAEKHLSGESLIQHLRKKRETECFPLINRGKLWYDSLTYEQKVELEEFYRAWLDVTKTLKIPTTPSWLK